MYDSIAPLESLVSLIPPPPRVPVEPTEAEVDAHWARIRAREAELAEIRRAMQAKQEARTVRPARRGKCA